MSSELTNDAIALLSDLISIPSLSREEDAAADFLEKHLESKGYIASRDVYKRQVVCHSFKS